LSASAVTILNVGWDSASRAGRSQALHEAGYRVHEAAAGSDAASLAGKIAPKLVILEPEASNGSDPGLSRQIERDFPASIIVLVPAGGNGADQLEDGAGSAPRRQVETAELVEFVQTLLRSTDPSIETWASGESSGALERAATQFRRARNMVAVVQHKDHQVHEFNNVLHAIRASLELIGNRNMEPRIAGLIERGVQAVARGSMIARQLLPIPHGRRSDLAPVDLNQVICRIAGRLDQITGSGVTLCLDLDPGIADAITNADQLELAIVNLAVNAREAMRDGGKLTVRTAEVDDSSDTLGLAARRFVEVQVLDTGCGMPPAVLERALEPFFTTGEVGEGAGLGLAQVDAIARQSGGAVRLESTVGLGTTVRIFLPEAAARPHALDRLPQAARPTTV
jgi:signal transduction histidine kinase